MFKNFLNKIIIFNFVVLTAVVAVFLFGHNVIAGTTKTVRIYASSTDGYITNWIKDIGKTKVLWDKTHDSLLGTSDGYGKEFIEIGSGWSSEGRFYIHRGVLFFDVSVIPKNSHILSAKLSVFVWHKTDPLNDDFDFITLVNATTSIENIITKNDFANISKSELYGWQNAFQTDIIEISKREDISNIAINNYLKFSLSTSSLSEIFNDNFFKIGLREGHDILDIYPDYPHNANADRIKIYTSEKSGTSTDPYLEVTYVVDDEPVIVVPGIMGSWKNKQGEWLLDPFLHTYDGLWQSLLAAGYTAGKDLFAAPYQWRESNVVSAGTLKDVIEQAKGVSGAKKVDIVAHSMGGLVARQYINSVSYENDIDQLIFLATPQKGAPEAYLPWEGGEFGKGLKNNLSKRLIAAEAYINGYSKKNGGLFAYIRNKPILSVKELLPIYDYLKDSSTGLLRIYPQNYPRNTFLEDLNSNAALTKLGQINTINIVAAADSASTINSYRVVPPGDDSLGRWEHGYPENYDKKSGDHGLIMGAGDGTVPFVSNGNFLSENTIINSSHRGIVTDAAAEVIKKLKGLNQPINDRVDIDNLLLVRIMSPAHFLLTNPEGLSLGVNNSGEEVNDIDLAFYDNGNIEFGTVPNPVVGEYGIVLNGYDSGEYRLVVSYLTEDTAMDKEFTGTVAPGERFEFKFNLATSGNMAVLGELNPLDNVAPSISISSPVDGGEYANNQILAIAYTVSDNFSGVSTTVVYLDEEVNNDSFLDLSELALGEHTLRVWAVDAVGNENSASVEFNIMAALDVWTQAIHDIKDLRAKGEISKKFISKWLITRLKHLQKLYKRYENMRNSWRGKILQKYLLFSLQRLTNRLDFYARKNWLSNKARQILHNDFEDIIMIIE